MQPLALQYNLLLGSQALDPTLQAVVNQVVSAVTAAFTEIKGATWSSSTDTLEQIRDNAGGGGGATASEIAGGVRTELTAELASILKTEKVSRTILALTV